MHARDSTPPPPHLPTKEQRNLSCLSSLFRFGTPQTTIAFLALSDFRRKKMNNNYFLFLCVRSTIGSDRNSGRLFSFRQRVCGSFFCSKWRRIKFKLRTEGMTVETTRGNCSLFSRCFLFLCVGKRTIIVFLFPNYDTGIHAFSSHCVVRFLLWRQETKHVFSATTLLLLLLLWYVSGFPFYSPHSRMYVTSLQHFPTLSSFVGNVCTSGCVQIGPHASVSCFKRWLRRRFFFV